MVKVLLVIGIISLAVYIVWKTFLIHTVVEYINVLYDANCTNTAILNPKNFLWTRKLRKNWKVIRKEYDNYKKYIPTHNELNSVTGACDTKGKWKTLYLRAFNKDTKLIDYFPKTKQLINEIPCTLAYFSILQPGAKLVPHFGLYKGVLRYHLALQVPTNNKKCYLGIKDKDNTIKRLHWELGKDIMFDDVYEHYAVNNTNEPRVVLFLDIKRDFNSWWLNTLNDMCLNFINTSDELQKTVDKINRYDNDN